MSELRGVVLPSGTALKVALEYLHEEATIPNDNDMVHPLVEAAGKESWR